jgi:hypothetical protein
MLLPNLFHLSLHHLVLIDKLIIGDSAVSILLMVELWFFLDYEGYSLLVFLLLLMV